jgi:HK97 family phage portal protein
VIVNALASLFGATTIDVGNPRDPAIAKMLGFGNSTKSGVSVDHDKVLALPAITRGINIISNAMAKLPWYVFRELPDGREFDKSHPSWKCITRKPNPEFTIGPLKKTLTAWAMGWGNGVAAIYAPNWPYGPVELIPLLPDRTKLVRFNAGGYSLDLMSGGELRYMTEVGGEKRWFDSSQVIHIRGLGGSPYWGNDVVDVLAETFGGALATSEFGHRFFGQGANPAGFIEMPNGLDEEAEETFMESLSKASQGLGKSHKFILLEEGAKFHQVTIDPEKAQLIATKTLDIRLLAMAIGIKVHKLIDGANSAFASLEQVNQEHKDDDLVPWICAFREEFNDKLLTIEQKDNETHCIDVDDEQLEWVPFSDRAAGCVQLYNNGLITKEEGRRKMNFGPSNSEYGDQYRIPSNITFEGEHVVNGTVQPGEGGQKPDGSGDNSNDNDEDEKNAFIAVSVALMGGIRDRIVKQAEAKSAKGASHFISWLENLGTQEAPTQIRIPVDAMVHSLADKFNSCTLKAKSDEELRTMVSESIRSILDENLENYLKGK